MSDLMIPIVIHDDPPPRCPKCNAVQDIIRVCARCGYRYRDQPTTVGQGVLIGLSVVIGLWLGITVLIWITITAMCSPTSGASYDRCIPLAEMLAAPYHWLQKAKLL